MPNTTEIMNVGVSTGDVSVPKLNQANLLFEATSTNLSSKTSLTRETTFVLTTAIESPLRVKVRQTTDPVKRIVFYSIIINTSSVEKDADDNVVEENPLDCGMWISRRMSKSDVSNEQILQVLGNVYALWYAGVDGSKDPTETLLARLRLGITNLY